MADPNRTSNPPGEATEPDIPPANPPAQEVNGSTTEAATRDAEPSQHGADSSLQTADNSLPPIDTTLPPIDPSIPHLDAPSLPAIDTSLPPIDTTLPAPDLNPPPAAADLSALGAETPNTNSYQPGNTTTAVSGSNNDATDKAGFQTPAPPAQPPSNGMYHPQQPVQQQPPPQQQQQHSQPPQYHPQTPGMSPNTQPSPTPMNAGSMPPGGHQAPGQHIPQAPIGSPLPTNMPPMPPMVQYMGYPSGPQAGVNVNAQMRYQMGDANRMLSGGRHKKEVKRRTKTGCLTCRKRRIKCDEGHPVCRNCVKSKRECLGYDPVFRPPSTAPSAIQPAPNPSPSLVVNPQEPPSYSGAPPGYVPAVSQSLAPSLHSESPTTSTDYGTTVDPALEANTPSSNMAGVQNTPEGTLQSALNPPTSNPTSAPEPSSFRLKQVRVNDLLALKNIAPPPPHPIIPLPQGRLEEIQAVFLATYAPAFDKFFETRWFQEKALAHLMANAQLMAEYSALIDAFNGQNLHDPNVIARLESFEASVVWTTMTMCRQVPGVSNGNQGQDYDLMATSARLNVVEALITGEHLESNPLANFPPRQPPSNPPTLQDQLAQRSLEFWSTVGHFLTLHDNEASSAKEIDDTLGRTRTLLDTFENRDVIYSIAIARHIGQRWADFPNSFPQPITGNEKDAGAKLYVAQKFLEQEASGKGTTQVIKRVCGMVVRSWYISRE